jgi:hypothetical protein
VSDNFFNDVIIAVDGALAAVPEPRGDLLLMVGLALAFVAQILRPKRLMAVR